MLRVTQIQARFGVALAFAFSLSACGSDANNTDASGGSGGEPIVGTGGKTGTGGTGTSSGGATTSLGGATTSSGGATTSSGGATTSSGGSGGATGSGGSSGGETGTGGTSGGSGGSGGSLGGGGVAGTGGAVVSPGGGAGKGGGPVSEAGMGGEAGVSGQEEAGAGGEAGAPNTEPPKFVGTGSDGNLTVAAATNIATANSGTRSCAEGGDAVSYSVTLLGSTTATLSSAPSAGCLAPGDEVLLINLQGTATHFANVGVYETLKVSALTAGVLTFATAKTHVYGDATDDTNIGIARTNQRVVLQRVPNYGNVSVPVGGSLSGSAWDGVKGGVLFFRATGTVSVAGSLSMSGKGYDGGANITTTSTTGQQGESINGLGTNVATVSQGGGGGGLGDNHGCRSNGTSGAGAGYGSAGIGGSTTCSGAGGGVYGTANLLTKLLLGSGGGSGGTDDTLADNPPGGHGGRGGGIVVIAASHLSIGGGVTSAGADGQGDTSPSTCSGTSTTNCWDYSGPGGAGSGGSILFVSAEASLGTNLVTAHGGLGGKGSTGGNAGDGGGGGDGRIAIQSLNAPSGATLPAAYSIE